MREALRKYDLEQNNTNTFKWEILEYLAFSVYMQGLKFVCHRVIYFRIIFHCFFKLIFYFAGNVHVAFKLTEELLSIYPDHERAKGNLEYYRNIIESEEKSKRKKGEDEDFVSFIRCIATLTDN